MPRKKESSSETQQMVVSQTDKSASTANRKTAERMNRSQPNGQSFYDVNYNEMDKNLTPKQQREWESIYASFRSKTPLSGNVIGYDYHRLTIKNPSTKQTEEKQILCLVVMDYRVKIIIPQTEVWFEPEKTKPDYVYKRMIGAKLNYVITNIDRAGECAIASRRMALRHVRSHFFRDYQLNEIGRLLTCNVLAVGPQRLIAECNGFDLDLRALDLSYTAFADLRERYFTGQELPAILEKSDQQNSKISVSVKAAAPNPFDGADKRHPVNCTRHAVVSGKYAGGLFCRLADDTTCMCLYSPAYFSEEFYIGDSVVIAITQFNYKKKQIYGKIISKIG